ncbi:lysophospholipid acyltransferase family protein [Janibacter corallicola]|uniref:lysophospholipid acyltransferase family protein n=1 Tax=Janibacter corallicola TaxID=415212 RepID=UPI0008365673|nr:lysophospholipid acyltransferase family protein [Janibacter corallicola]
MAESSSRSGSRAPAKGATSKTTAKRTTPTKSAATKAGSGATSKKTTTPKKATAAKKATSAGGAASRSRRASGSSVAAAAERAGGERARRRSTPLLTDASAGAAAGTRTARSKGGRGPALRVVPDVDGAPPTKAAPAKKSTRKPPPRKSTSKQPPTQPAAASEASTKAATPTAGQAIVPGLAEMLSVLLSAGQLASRTLGQAAGAAAGDEWEERFAEALQFLQRRVTGEYVVDNFGFDKDFTTHTVFPVLRLLKEKWFRIEVRGIENIPDEGGALVVSNHSGTVAIDSVMTQLALHDAHPKGRFLRMLGADLVFQLPVVGDIARKTGSTLAANADANRLLREGELVGVWPEGFKGVGKPFRERYKLQRFGRGGFVSTAIRAEVPIIPCSVVGAEEVYPMIGNMKTLARLVGAPYAPITPFFPLLGPLGLVPLPSKWIIEFGPPIDTASLGPAAAEDPMLLFEFTDQVRETIQQTLYSILVTRRSVFF